MSNKVNDSSKYSDSKKLDLKGHWNKAYRSNPEEKLGWYETDPSPSIKLIEASNLPKSAKILVIGSGSTTLVDSLVEKEYTSIIATDLSEVALTNLSGRLNTFDHVEYIVDDLINPKDLKNIDNVDLWIDRAVLHFFVEENDQKEYFKLLRSKVKKGAFVIFAEFAIDGARKCSGLPVLNYSANMLLERLGKDFKLLEEFDYSYTMPSGDNRPYIYTLFKRK